MKTLPIVFAAFASLPAWADEARLTGPLLPAYKTECGSCHTPFPPGLLNPGDWKKTMAGLDQHFGTDAALDAKTAGQIGAWLQQHAGRTMGRSPDPEPRLTTTRWFVREHREVPARAWQDPRVKNAANCAACHKGADQGQFGERELSIPGYGRRHDD